MSGTLIVHARLPLFVLTMSVDYEASLVCLFLIVPWEVVDHSFVPEMMYAYVVFTFKPFPFTVAVRRRVPTLFDLLGFMDRAFDVRASSPIGCQVRGVPIVSAVVELFPLSLMGLIVVQRSSLQVDAGAL
jgi:hypothetical protein